ncbi:flagellar biosynthesis regulator FlaF [Nguyenibacter vanlangensis]|uniref:Flagellar biosynthesis regulator FlaF n=1 Tax=Nguyenibacter vanlangensis TaxID=1216886 RepID=A0ABZ3D2E9_9PROT
MIHPAIKAYQSISGSSLSGREAEAACFRMLIDELETASLSSDVAVRRLALSRHQRFWSMIMQANALDNGLTPEEDRRLFVRLADQAQRYGIRAILYSDVSLAPLIEIAENVLAGLEAVSDSDAIGADPLAAF